MTAKEALTKLTVMLGLNTPEVLEASSEETVETTETVEVQFAEAQLVDGTVVMTTTSEINVGDILLISVEEGEPPFAPAGLHETTDGLIITVGENGEILMIEEKAAEEAPAEAPVEEAVVAEADFSEDLVKSISDLIAPALNEINSLKEEIATLQSNFSSFKEEPAGKKITNNLSEYKEARQSFSDSRFEQLRKMKG